MEAILIIITLILLTILGLILYKIITKKNRHDKDDNTIDGLINGSDATIDGKPIAKGNPKSEGKSSRYSKMLSPENAPIKLVQNKYCDYEDSFTTSVDPNIVGDPNYIDYYSTECSCGANRPCWKVKIFENGNFCSKRCDKYHEKIKNYP